MNACFLTQEISEGYPVAIAIACVIAVIVVALIKMTKQDLITFEQEVAIFRKQQVENIHENSFKVTCDDSMRRRLLLYSIGNRRRGKKGSTVRPRVHDFVCMRTLSDRQDTVRAMDDWCY